MGALPECMFDKWPGTRSNIWRLAWKAMCRCRFLRITHTVVMPGDARSSIRLDGFLFNFYLEFYALAQNKHVNSYSNDFESTSLSCMLSQQPRCP